MIIDFIPKCFEGESKEFEGKISVKQMSVIQKYELLDAANRGETEIQKLIAGIKMVASHVDSVNIKRLADGKEFKSYDELVADAQCDVLVQEIVAFVFAGCGVSKK